MSPNTTPSTANIDTIGFFDDLATAMNNDPARYELLGDIDLELAVVMHRDDRDAFRVRLGFHGIQCQTVVEIDEGEEAAAECWLEGDLEDWKAMFADIATNGRAQGPWTLNALTLMGDRIRLEATDPMGWDKFHRFNQTLQDFVDASANILNREVSNASS